MTSRLTYAETRAALARMRAQRRLTTAQQTAIVRDLEELWAATAILEVADGTVRLAGDLADRHGLRGYDAVHLATALDSGVDDELRFACWDAALRAAAGTAGLRTVPA